MEPKLWVQMNPYNGIQMPTSNAQTHGRFGEINPRNAHEQNIITAVIPVSSHEGLESIIAIIKPTDKANMI